MRDKEKDHKNIFQHSMHRSSWDIYLSDGLVEASNYISEINILRQAGPDDEINFYINCYGGYVYTGLQFLNAMQECKANINTIMDGTCASMAAFLVLAGDTITVNESSYLMFHDISGGGWGKVGSENFPTAEFYKELAIDLLKRYGSKILTKKERDLVAAGTDIYLTSKDIRDRLK